VGAVTHYLRSQIAKQIDDNGIVVWYDPEQTYAAIVDSLDLPKTHFASYQDSFFTLRHQVDHLLDSPTPPRLLVYVPLEPADTAHALAELEAAGVVMKPGQQPPQRNTRLSVIARQALKPILGEETVETIVKQVETGQLLLTDLDNWSDEGGITQGVVSVIFGTGNPQEVALAFLSSPSFDTPLTERDAVSELAQLLQNTFGVKLLRQEAPPVLRTRLARHVLTMDLVSGFQGNLPSQLESLPVPAQPSAREACINLVKAWRLRRDLAESYSTQAMLIQQELGLHSLSFELANLLKLETFLAVETALQQNVESALLNTPNPDLVAIADERKSSFWSEYRPDIQAHWALVSVTGQLLLIANQIEQALKSTPANAKTLFNAYTASENPWCLLDTHHRHMERRWHDFDSSLHQCHQSLDQLVSCARDRYMDVGGQLAEKFITGYQKAKFRLDGVLHQTEIFDIEVKPTISTEGEDHKVALIWVDALRYEMARELAQVLQEDYRQTLQAAIAAVPTITEIGMAALLPGINSSTEIITVGPSKLGVQVGDMVLKDRASRVKFLQLRAGTSVFAAKLDDLLPKPKKKVRNGIEHARLTLITSQEIDWIGEGNNVRLARLTMDSILYELRRGIQVLSGLGIRTIVITADHGYLFGEELRDDMKLDAPGGQKADLHRRVWIGKGGDANSNYLRAKLADFGLTSEFEIVTPLNFACFKVSGGTEAYFHGGLSPQELIIPLITLSPKELPQASLTSDIHWSISPGTQKITTRFVSVQIKGTATSLFKLVPPRVRVEVKHKREVISRLISASYGFEEATGEVQLSLVGDNLQNIEPNTVALMITEAEPTKQTVFIHLSDATTGVELIKAVKIDMEISM